MAIELRGSTIAVKIRLEMVMKIIRTVVEFLNGGDHKVYKETIKIVRIIKRWSWTLSGLSCPEWSELNVQKMVTTNHQRSCQICQNCRLPEYSDYQKIIGSVCIWSKIASWLYCHFFQQPNLLVECYSLQFIVLTVSTKTSSVSCPSKEQRWWRHWAGSQWQQSLKRQFPQEVDDLLRSS